MSGHGTNAKRIMFKAVTSRHPWQWCFRYFSGAGEVYRVQEACLGLLLCRYVNEGINKRVIGSRVTRPPLSCALQVGNKSNALPICFVL